jgi:hypothetical protein
VSESVYISSTYNDLKNFRQAVINCIVSLGDYYKPVSMEFYDSEDIHFVKKCLDDVEACDIYILILGKRYGYIPKDFKKSITELEYEKARECQKNGKLKQILIFKVGDLANTYAYKENDPNFVEYQQNFLDEVEEQLTPKPFDSEAELCLQVSHSLMKRLFKLIRLGEKIIPPDKDSVLCYCDRSIPITDLKRNVLINRKKIFFLQGNRKTDYPGGIVKRFAKYSLGSFNKIEPLIKITDLFTSNDKESNYVSAFWNILEYLNRSATETNTAVDGFLKELSFIKSNKIILPFYYDFDFDEDSNKIGEFFSFSDYVFNAIEIQKPAYQLYFIIIIYSDQPDKSAITDFLTKYEQLKKLASYIDKLKLVPDDDVMDWLEKFITTIEFSAALYQEYFKEAGKDIYNMQEVNLKLSEIIEDLGNGKERIKKYL